jgi:hypothetical protein
MPNGRAFPCPCCWSAPDSRTRFASWCSKADRGVPKEEPKPPAPISYARSIPRARAMEPDVLIAYQMNGQDLTPDHGYPLRAIVPGHYGMASVKWLTDIVAATQPFQGYWQTSDYGYWDDSEGIPVRRPLAEMKLKSQIARPCVYERLEPNRPYSIFGAAWAGDTEVAEIWISLDGGASWVQGDFLDPISRHAWRRWKYDWITPAQPGRYTLLARDRSQPTYPTSRSQSKFRQLCDRSPAANRSLCSCALNWGVRRLANS